MRKKQYKCLDEDCGRVVSEEFRLALRRPGRPVIWKCPYCRGRLKEVEEKDE